MRKTFLLNLILLLSLNFLIKPVWMFGIDLKVQNLIGSDGYGLYFALLNLSLILNILLDVGITNFNNREIARDPQKLNEIFSRIFSLKLVLGVLYAVVCLLVGIMAGYKGNDFFWLMLLILNQFLNSFILYLRSNISGLHMFRTDSLLSVSDRLLMIIICGALLWTDWGEGSFKISWFILAQTVSYILVAALSFGIVVWKSGNFTIRFSSVYSLEIIRKSYPYAILVLLMSLYMRLSPVLLERMAGPYEAGIFAQGFRLLDAFSMLGVLMAGLLLPMFSRLFKEGKSIEPLLRISFITIILPSLMVTVAGYFFREEIMKALYHDYNELSPSVFSWLMVGFLGISTSYIFGTLLTAGGNLKELNLMAGATVVLSILLNLLLIPFFNSKGAAMASALTQLFSAMVQVLLAYRIFKFTLPYRILRDLGLFFLLLCFSGYLLREFPLPWLISLGIFLVTGFTYPFLLGMIKIQDLKKIFLKEEV